MQMPCPVEWSDIVVAIFERQRQLMDKYKVIEHLPNPPVSLHTLHGQKIIRDFAWRVTEELTESQEALITHADAFLARERGLEEMADATHFFVELLIFAGVSPKACVEQIQGWPRAAHNMAQAYWNVVYSLGIAMNFLKNKAWKQSQTPTNEAKFRTQLLHTFAQLIRLWATMGCKKEDLFEHYFKKSAIIDQRLEENY
jgi:hypothetical protein